MAGHQEVVLPGQGWMLSRLTNGEEVVFEHCPIVAWVFLGTGLGLAPMAPVDGASTATLIKNPWVGDRTMVQLVWHPDQIVREEAELRLVERLGRAQAGT